MRKPVRNTGASVRARLLNVARAYNRPLDLILTRYALERLLYRLSTTKHRDRFVLKGAILMTTWFNNPFRPTRDLDFLGFGESDPQDVNGCEYPRKSGGESGFTMFRPSPAAPPSAGIAVTLIRPSTD